MVVVVALHYIILVFLVVTSSNGLMIAAFCHENGSTRVERYVSVE